MFNNKALIEENKLLKDQLETQKFNLASIMEDLNEIEEKQKETKYVAIEIVDLQSEQAKVELYKIATSDTFRFLWMSMREANIDILTKLTTEKEILRQSGVLVGLNMVREVLEKYAAKDIKNGKV